MAVVFSVRKLVLAAGAVEVALKERAGVDVGAAVVPNPENPVEVVACVPNVKGAAAVVAVAPPNPPRVGWGCLE